MEKFNGTWVCRVSSTSILLKAIAFPEEQKVSLSYHKLLWVHCYSAYLHTLDYLITQHVGLFFFKKKSALCMLITSCWFINFRKIFHPVRLLDPVRLLISEHFLLCWIIFSEKFHDGSIFKGQLFLLWSNCTIAMIPLMKIPSYWHYCT